MLMTFLVSFFGNETVLAKTFASAGVIKTKSGNKRTNNNQKEQHSARKQAAKRLRIAHQHKHEVKLRNWASLHNGYSGLGQVGDGLNNNQLPGHTGGAQ
jgi:hypothetical protein